MYSHLIALNPSRQRIVKVTIADGTVSDFIDGVTDFPDGIVVNHAENALYWTNMGAPGLPADHPPRQEADLNFYRRNGSLERAALDGSDRSVVLAPGSFVTGKQLAGAWQRNRLYWSDREGAAVLSVSLQTGHVRAEVVVAQTERDRHVVRNQCVGVAVDETNGWLYWTQKGPADGGDGRIFRAPLDIPAGQTAQSREVEVLWSDLPEPIDLELDLQTGVIYWTDRGTPPTGNTLNRAHIPAAGRFGGAIDILSADFHEAIGLAVDTDAGIAYVSDLSGEIRGVALDGTGQRLIATVPGGLTGIAGISE
jgi:DNA-binding beta-propeller fold protein YncE